MEHAAAIDTSDLAVEKDFIGLKADVGLLDFHNWLMFQLVWIT